MRLLALEGLLREMTGIIKEFMSKAAVLAWFLVTQPPCPLANALFNKFWAVGRFVLAAFDL